MSSLNTDSNLDHRVLHQQILRQAMDDYVKLQHPKQRRKKYLKEAWWTSIDLFFDPSYRFTVLVNDIGKEMSLNELLMVAADRENLQIDKLHDYLIKSANDYWEVKPMRTVDIPTDFVIEGHVYEVKYKETDGYRVNYKNKLLWIDSRISQSSQEELFVVAVTEIVAYHSEAKMSERSRQLLAKGWFRALRMNNCFNGEF